jgi:hypothetical protein
MLRQLPWPFPDDRFPEQLGAVVMRTVLSQDHPALHVAHGPDGSWMIADGIGDPNETGACIATHIWHVVTRDPTIEELAGMPPGSQANRRSITDSWTVSPFEYAP